MIAYGAGVATGILVSTGMLAAVCASIWKDIR